MIRAHSSQPACVWYSFWNNLEYWKILLHSNGEVGLQIYKQVKLCLVFVMQYIYIVFNLLPPTYNDHHLFMQVPVAYLILRIKALEETW